MKRDKKNGQVTLEFGLVFIIVVILFWASALLFLYLNNRMLFRQQYYESHEDFGRVRAGNNSVDTEVQVDENEFDELNFWSP